MIPNGIDIIEDRAILLVSMIYLLALECDVYKKGGNMWKFTRKKK